MWPLESPSHFAGCEQDRDPHPGGDSLRLELERITLDKLRTRKSYLSRSAGLDERGFFNGFWGRQAGGHPSELLQSPRARAGGSRRLLPLTMA